MNSLIRQLLLMATLAVVLGLSFPGVAGNIDVSTVPQRNSVQLTIYNSEDITLVRETRKLTFKTGMNPLQFSWANTLIDSSSVQLRFLDHKDQLDLLDTTFPYDRPQLLEWGVRSEFDGEAMVEITYFTSGISWAADYVCVSDAGEGTLGFEGFVRITNNSGEEYRDAQVRLVVGTISLVEKISELAQRGIVEQWVAQNARDGATYGMLRKDMPMEARHEVERSLMDKVAKPGEPTGGPILAKEIIKEGLSEYFIYTIDGTETIPNGWSKRLRLFEGLDAPFSIEYRWRPAEYGDQLVRMFILRNDEASKLGSTPLPDGVVRLFRENGREGLSFVVQQAIKYVPIGQEIELNLGRDPEVIHERLILSNTKQNFWFSSKKANTYYSPTQGNRIEPDYEVAGWDLRSQVVERLRNYRGKPIKVQFRLSFDGDVTFESQLKPSLHDFRSPQFESVVAAGETKDLAYTFVQRVGFNQKQQRVELK